MQTPFNMGFIYINIFRLNIAKLAGLILLRGQYNYKGCLMRGYQKSKELAHVHRELKVLKA